MVRDNPTPQRSGKKPGIPAVSASQHRVGVRQPRGLAVTGTALSRGELGYAPNEVEAHSSCESKSECLTAESFTVLLTRGLEGWGPDQPRGQ